MIGVVYLGNNATTQERLKYIPGQLVKITNTYKDAAIACKPQTKNDHFIIFIERNIRNEDITSITYLRKKCKNIYFFCTFLYCQIFVVISYLITILFVVIVFVL